MQIDAIQVVQRSHYLVIWSRLGNYDMADLDRLIFGDKNDRRLFEYWWHAASIIPLTEYRYRLPVMRYFQDGGGKPTQAWLARPESSALVSAVLKQIHQKGALRVSDFNFSRSQ